MKHSHSFLKYYLKASGDHFTSQAITFNCEISSLFKFTTSTILCMCTFVNYLLGNNVLCSYVIVNFIFAFNFCFILAFNLKSQYPFGKGCRSIFHASLQGSRKSLCTGGGGTCAVLLARLTKEHWRLYVLGRSGCYFMKYSSLVIYRSLSWKINKKEAPQMLPCKTVDFYTNDNLPSIIEVH